MTTLSRHKMASPESLVSTEFINSNFTDGTPSRIDCSDTDYKSPAGMTSNLSICLSMYLIYMYI